MKRASLLTLTLIGAFSAIQAAWAVDYPLPPTGSRLVGQNQTYTVQEGDKNLQAIARRFDTDIVNFDVRPWFEKMALTQHLTPSRSQGLEAMIRAIRAKAAALS